jgi:formylglycine-generating enzyme required for sulfatase activity
MTNSLGMKFALVPPGEFLMGSPEDEPERGDDEHQHLVRITRPFFLGVYEVTQAEYRKVMAINPSFFNRKKVGKDASRFPVEQVSWEDAVLFCRRLSAMKEERSSQRVYRLPTEAEWEYTCRAGTTTATAFGVSLSSAQANFRGDFPFNRAARGPNLNRTAAVGSYLPNAFGLYDMHGNVLEWCHDNYTKENYYYSAPMNDPQGPSSGEWLRVHRGGSWGDYGANCRSAKRDKISRHDWSQFLGFRVALSWSEK